MAYLETITSGITADLQDAGLTAYTEYELQTAAVPNAAQFVTVGIAALKGDMPLSVPNGTAVPTDVRLRVRMHGRAGCDPDQLTMLWELYVLPVLMQSGFALGDMKLSEIRYDKTLDRLLREAEISVPALLTRSGA